MASTVVLKHGLNKEKKKMSSHHFALKIKIDVCSIFPIFSYFQPPQNDEHQTNLD